MSRKFNRNLLATLIVLTIISLAIALLFVHSISLVTLFSGISIFMAATLIGMASEAAEKFVPRAISLAVVAFLAVLPEYAVDAYLAWMAAKNPEYAHYALANMTGANRLLLGFGWAVVALVGIYFLRKENPRVGRIRLGKNEDLIVAFLLLASVYVTRIIVLRQIDIVDSIVLIGIYAVYILIAKGIEEEELELHGPSKYIAEHSFAKALIIFLFALGGVTVLLVADKFSEGLIEVAKHAGLSPFLAVQWLAPLASESPEMVVALYFAARRRAHVGIAALVSSKLNQWTLLVGMLPIIYSVSAGSLLPFHIDEFQMHEIFLTSSQTLYGAGILLDNAINVLESIALLVPFFAQLLIPGIRLEVSYFYIVAGVAISAVRLRKRLRGKKITTLVRELFT